MDPETRELATATVEALQIMAANSSNRLGDIIGLLQCGLIGYGLWIMHRGNIDRTEQMKSQQQYQQQQTATLADIGTALRQQGAVLADIGAGIQELLRDRNATRKAD